MKVNTITVVRVNISIMQIDDYDLYPLYKMNNSYIVFKIWQNHGTYWKNIQNVQSYCKGQLNDRKNN